MNIVFYEEDAAGRDKFMWETGQKILLSNPTPTETLRPQD